MRSRIDKFPLAPKSVNWPESIRFSVRASSSVRYFKIARARSFVCELAGETSAAKALIPAQSKAVLQTIFERVFIKKVADTSRTKVRSKWTGDRVIRYLDVVSVGAPALADG